MLTFVIATVYSVSFLVCYWCVCVDDTYDTLINSFFDNPKQLWGEALRFALAPWIPGVNTLVALERLGAGKKW